MSPMAVAIERRDWDRVALYLLLGADRLAALLPAETLEALLDLLSADMPKETRRGR